jgi:hypothetical protein
MNDFGYLQTHHFLIHAFGLIDPFGITPEWKAKKADIPGVTAGRAGNMTKHGRYDILSLTIMARHFVSTLAMVGQPTNAHGSKYVI